MSIPTDLKWIDLTDEQQQLMRMAFPGEAFTLGTWEERRVRAAEELIRAGLLTGGGLHERSDRNRIYWITLAGRVFVRAAREMGEE